MPQPSTAYRRATCRQLGCLIHSDLFTPFYRGSLSGMNKAPLTLTVGPPSLLSQLGFG